MVHPPQPVAPAWAASDLDPATWSCDLAAEAVAQLRAALDRTAAEPLERLHRDDHELAALEPALQAVERALDPRTGPGFAVLGRLPVRDLGEDDVLRMVWLIGTAFGTPVTQSTKADFVGHVRRSPGASALRGYTSAAPLGFHADLTPLAALASRRVAVRGGESAVVSSGAVHNRLLAEAPALLATAYEPFPMGRLGEEAEGEPAWSAQPIFAQEDGAFGAFYNRALIDHAQTLDGVPALTAEQAAVLDLVDEETTRPELHLRHVLAEGEVLFLNNTQVLHSRTGFDDHDDPDERRHLFRLWWDAPRLAALVPATVRYPYRFGRTGLTPAEAATAGASPAPA